MLVKVARIIEEGRQNAKAPLPAVLTIVQSIGEPRYPSFIGIRKAAKAVIPVWSISDLGTSAPAQPRDPHGIDHTTHSRSELRGDLR